MQMDNNAYRRAVIAVGLTLLVAACGSSSPTAAAKTGMETFRASTTDLSAINSTSDIVSVTASGLAADSGTVPLGGNSTSVTIRLRGGDVKVSHSRGIPHQHIGKACAVSFADTGPYKITGGTGKYAGATGHGTSTVSFSGTVPKYSNGQCDINSSKLSRAREIFIARGPMTLKS
jgi:hypothetical protein